MNEPVVGAPLLAVLLNGSAFGSVVAVSPHWMETLKVNVSPTWELLNVWLRNTWFTFWPGPSVITALLSVNPETPVPSVATTRMLMYSVTVDGFVAPSLKVMTLLYLESEKRWFHVS